MTPDATNALPENFNPTGLTPGERFRHYKGETYEFVMEAIWADTTEPIVVYRSVSNGTMWARPLENWSAEVKFNGQVVRRFEKIS